MKCLVISMVLCLAINCLVEAKPIPSERQLKCLGCPPPFFPEEDLFNHRTRRESNFLAKLAESSRRVPATSEHRYPWDCIGCSPPYYDEQRLKFGLKNR